MCLGDVEADAGEDRGDAGDMGTDSYTRSTLHSPSSDLAICEIWISSVPP